ncbi:MAG: glycosyltransferase [Dermatophilaceae bacterium]
MLNNAACIHCTAEFELAQARKHFDSSRVRGEVIPLVFDLSGVPKRARGGDGAGEVQPARRRGTDAAVPEPDPCQEGRGRAAPCAAAELVKRGVNFRLAIAGTGDAPYEQEMKSLAASLGLQGDRAKFLGLVTGDEKVSLYQAADVLLIPTSQENFGFVFVESLAAGTPLVTTKGVDTWPELEASGGATIIGRDPAEWASTVERLVKDRAALRESGRRGREWALANLDVGARRWRNSCEMYERVAGGDERASSSGRAGGTPGNHGA